MSKHNIVMTGLGKQEFIKMIENGVQYKKCINCGRTSKDESVVIVDGDIQFKEMRFFVHEVAESDGVTMKYHLCIECLILKEDGEGLEEMELSESLSSNE